MLNACLGQNRNETGTGDEHQIARYIPTNPKHNINNVTYSALWIVCVCRHNLLSNKKTCFLRKNTFSYEEEEKVSSYSNERHAVLSLGNSISDSGDALCERVENRSFNVSFQHRGCQAIGFREVVPEAPFLQYSRNQYSPE